MTINRHVSPVVLLFIIVGLGSSCSRLQPGPYGSGNDVAGEIRNQVNEWQMSETGRGFLRGLSAFQFIHEVYREPFGIILPTDPESLLRTGQEVNGRRFQGGDILFFRDSANNILAGVYLNPSEILYMDGPGNLTSGSLTGSLGQTLWTSRRVLISYSP